MGISKRLVVVVALLAVAMGAVGCIPLNLAEPLYELYNARPPADVSYETTEGAGDSIFKEGPALTDVSKLPVDSSGKGMIVGVAPGEANWSDNSGHPKADFQFILAPAPAGVPVRSTLAVHVDESTRFLMDGVDNGRAIDGMGGGSGKDPTYDSMQMIVTFHIRDGQVWADTLNEASQELNNP